MSDCMDGLMGSTLAKRIGRRIAEARKTLGLTQAAVAEKVNLDPISLSRIERGVALPGLTTLELIASVLRLPLTHLLAETSATAPSVSQEISDLLSNLPEEHRLFLLAQLKSWSSHLRKTTEHPTDV